jgi:hypothetical protein
MAGLPAYYATVRYGTIDFGDRLLMMNGVAVRDVNHEHLTDMMRAASTLVLIFRHDPSDLAMHVDSVKQVRQLQESSFLFVFYLFMYLSFVRSFFFFL